MHYSDSYLVPEWAPQEALVLAWPHMGTDWSEMLHEVEDTYFSLVRAIARWQPLIVLTKDPDELTARLAGHGPEKITVIGAETNDTWVRDYLPLWTKWRAGFELLDFGFNAWGVKFPYSKDNAVAKRLYGDNLLFNNHVVYRDIKHFILEGGSIETDGMGTVITTERCLCTDTRNPKFSKVEIDRLLRRRLYARDILWLQHGYIEGDDTDGHVDTLVRFCDADTIAYASCDDESDTQYTGLKRMESEIMEWSERSGRNHRLVPVLMPHAVRDEHGRRLPATYLNFTIIRGAVLVPQYNTNCDNEAMQTLAQCFPHRKLIGVYAGTLIKQGGSIHCATAHIPQGCVRKI